MSKCKHEFKFPVDDKQWGKLCKKCRKAYVELLHILGLD
jgi:hypothetical protein